MHLKNFYRDWERLKNYPGYHSLTWWMLDQSFWVILVYRLISSARGTIFHVPLRILEKIAEFVFKSYIPSTVEIGPGLVIYHAFGIIINGKSRIGKNCTLYARVCIGQRFPGDRSPILGDNVTVGTGACVLGPVELPDGFTVPANAVITPKTLSIYTR